MSLPNEPTENGTAARGLAQTAAPAKIGVYVCHCGVNIAGKVDVEQVVASAATFPGVTVARNYRFMCSSPGQELIQQDIRDGLVDRVVVASCSPLMHAATFRAAAAAAGISPFQTHLASIREHVSWVTADGDEATRKATALVAGAVRRVALHESLDRRHAPVTPAAMVIGGGIAGIQTALTLAAAGKHVYLVEKEASVGGQMAKLDKTFPTLDCAACILTPKMVQAGQHPDIELLTLSEVKEVRGHVGDFHVTVRRKARYIDESLCTGCDRCVESCTGDGFRSEFDHGLGTRRAVHKPFPQAVPAVPVVERAGRSPCTATCPAGITAHGYVSLVRRGEYAKAFELVSEVTPLVGTLGRACYARCERDCTRAGIEAPLPIRRIKRFVADMHYGTARAGAGSRAGAATPTGRRVAVVGSGPAGLTAAWQLARRGHGVTVFEAEPVAGGMLRTAIPEYRLPAAVVERDIENLTAAGVEILTGTRIEDLGELRRHGYAAVLLATGTPASVGLDVPGADLTGVVSGLDFLRSVKRGDLTSLPSGRVVVVGGGNVAMDAARTARRLGVGDVVVAYRRRRADMPAFGEEVHAAEQEGARFVFRVAPLEVVSDGDGHVSGLRCVRTVPGTPDASGRARPEPVPGTEFVIDCQRVINATGLRPDVGALTPRPATSASGTVRVDPGTLRTDLPGVFAAGDVERGPLDIAHAVGRGRRAGLMIDGWLRGEPPDPSVLDGGQAVADAADALARARDAVPAGPLVSGVRFERAPHGFAEIEPPMTEEEARGSAGRCLDCGVCSECGECVAACDVKAIDLSMRDRELELEVGAIVVATGFQPLDARRVPEYGYGRYPNVYTSLEVERLLNASGPTHGDLVLRTGGRPRSVAIIHCVGSRDSRYHSYCSRVCCMASLKLAHLVRERSGAEVFNFYIDMRAPGKGYEEFFGQVRSEGVHFVRGRAAEVTDWTTTPEEQGRLVVCAEDTVLGVARRVPVDMVVLAVAVEPRQDAEQVSRLLHVSRGPEGFFAERHPKLAPVSTFTDGVFLAGTCQGPKDIPDTVAQAGAAAAEVLAMVDRGSVELEPSTAFVDPARCSGCRVCIGLCRFGALSFDSAANVAVAEEVLCKGCGVCVAACPSGALQQHLFTDGQVLAEIEGVLQDV